MACRPSGGRAMVRGGRCGVRPGSPRRCPCSPVRRHEHGCLSRRDRYGAAVDRRNREGAAGCLPRGPQAGSVTSCGACAPTVAKGHSMTRIYEYKFVRIGEYSGSALFGVRDKDRNTATTANMMRPALCVNDREERSIRSVISLHPHRPRERRRLIPPLPPLAATTLQPAGLRRLTRDDRGPAREKPSVAHGRYLRRSRPGAPVPWPSPCSSTWSADQAQNPFLSPVWSLPAWRVPLGGIPRTLAP
jgi:hypothetical protein